VTGNQVNYSKHCRLEFGEYVQTHEEQDNTMIPRTKGALALRPTGNVQGSHLFFSLASGVITRNHWTVLPMPEEVVDRIRIMRSGISMIYMMMKWKWMSKLSLTVSQMNYCKQQVMKLTRQQIKMNCW
jgi:hypothetical protein